MRVLAPVPGRVLTLAEVPDEVFARGMVGPGLAIDPAGGGLAGAGPVIACAPVAGRVLKAYPHAFVLVSDDRGVLVHLGIDTVQLEGVGFSVHVRDGQQVVAGEPVITFDPATVADGGRSPVCPVIALDGAPEQVHVLAGERVTAGAPLFDWV